MEKGLGAQFYLPRAERARKAGQRRAATTLGTAGAMRRGGEEEVTFRHLQGRGWPNKVSHFRTPLRSSSLDGN